MSAPDRLVLSPRVNVESAGADGVVVFHTDTASRLRLTPALYEVLRRFEHPATVDEAAGGSASPGLARSIEALRAKGYLLAEGEGVGPAPERRLATTSHTLFQCPRGRPGGPPARVTVVGVPSDLGVRGWPGSRAAPEEIRKRSYDFTYRCAAHSGEPMGWFDVAARRRVCQGVSFADWGDVWLRYGEPLRALHERTREVCADIARAGSFPLLVGGDQTLAWGAVAALAEREPLCVLWLDAHTDYDHTPAGAAVNNGGVARAVHALPGVARMVQAGHRGYTANDKVVSHERLEIVTGPELARRGPAAVVGALPPGHPVYVSLDINLLDPVYAPAATNPAPGGMTLDALKELLAAVGESRRVVGMDLSEVNPSRDVGSITAITACHVLLAALGAFLPSPTPGHANGRHAATLE